MQIFSWKPEFELFKQGTRNRIRPPCSKKIRIYSYSYHCVGFHVQETRDMLFHLTANVRGLVTRGKLTKDKSDKALSMLNGALDYSDFRDVDMVIEVCNSWVFSNKNLKLFCIWMCVHKCECLHIYLVLMAHFIFVQS